MDGGKNKETMLSCSGDIFVPRFTYSYLFLHMTQCYIICGQQGSQITGLRNKATENLDMPSSGHTSRAAKTA